MTSPRSVYRAARSSVYRTPDPPRPTPRSHPMPTLVVNTTRLMSASEQQILDLLAAAAARRDKANGEARDLIRAGLSAGIPQMDLATAARVDRGVVHRIKRDHDAAPAGATG